MKTRKTNTTVTRPRKHPKPAALIAAFAALTLAGPTLTEARTGDGFESAAPVTVIGRDQIESTPNISRDIRDFTRLQPGIVTEGYGAGSYGTANNGNNISIRGVNTNTRFNNTYNEGITHVPTGLYVDPSQLERVEVLRGPQGTLYGRNNLGVNLNTRYSDRAEPIETGYTEQPYDLGVGYKYNDIKFNPGVNYDPNALGTGRINAGLHETVETAANTPSHTPVYDYGGYRAPCPKVKRHEINNRIANNRRRDSAYQATGLLLNSQEPRFFDYNYYNTATDELANRAIIGNQLAQANVANNAYGLSGRDQLIRDSGCYYPDPNKPYIGGDDAPKTYYRVAGGDFTPTTTISNDDSASGTGTAKTELPPIPEYKSTVRPINTKEMNDRQLQTEIEYGPSLIGGYQREATELRDDAKRYRRIAQERRDAAKRARADAEAARKKAKSAKRDSSREFWEQQAEAYDGHAEILEDSARGLDHSAANDDAAAETYEQDAAQTAANYGQALVEQAQRQAQTAAQAARAQAAREAEAARVEAERRRQLDELLRQSQQSSQNSTGNQPNNSSRPRQPYRPDERIPRPGREPRNETIRKLLD